uniref:Aminopeptidase n=1 Tax=Clastoptera arizonana TaxID=38151 RepID=A0A1B6CLC6_9HEMI
MAKTPEVIAVMEATTTLTPPNSFLVSRLNAALLFTAFIVCMVGTALATYHLTTCTCTPGGTFSELIDDSAPPRHLPYSRLPTSVVPHSYNIRLIPFIQELNFTFDGHVRIVVNVTRDTDNITMHMYDIEVLSTEIDGGVSVVSTHNDVAGQFFIIKTSNVLEAGKQYTVDIKYIGKLNDQLLGFYRSSYNDGTTKRWIATTQFQATGARRAFPCFDEPALKSRFTISIGRPSNMSSVSNMPKKKDSETPVEGVPNYIWDHYEESVPMSTYLVAFTVDDFSYLSNTERNFTVWARKDAIEQAQYSLVIGPKILKHYEQYFNISFPLPKIDMIALPDFAAGAMENWGLITYRETAMLYQKDTSTNKDKERVANVVSHELAHQWFGNLVTPSWWTDLWLNEGFATYVENLGMDVVEPSWKVMDQFVVHELQNVFLLDMYKSSHPISVEVHHPNEIDEIFDSISYSKGASIIRMMDHFLTTDVFKKGLYKYLSSKAYSSATQDDLWEALTKQAHEDNVLDQSMTVKQIMDTWTLQTGFPLITVTRQYDSKEAIVSQKRFLMGNTTDTNNSLWWVPLTYTWLPQPDFETTTTNSWLKNNETSMVIDIEARSHQWVVFNIKQTGFYRVNYDADNWKLLTKHLIDPNRFQQIGVINRAQLVGDALNLARAGALNYSVALDLTQYLAQELEYLPWKSAFTAFSHINSMLMKTGGYDKFKAFILQLVKKLYEDVGFIDNPSDNQLRVYKRLEVLKWTCSMGFEDCVRNAITQFQNWRSTPQPDKHNPISPNLKSTVYCTAIRAGGQAEWDFAWERYLRTNVGSEKSLLLSAMGCSKETWILSRYLDRALTVNSGIRKQDAASVLSAVSNNVIGQPLAFALMRDNWKRIIDYFEGTAFTINTVVQISTNGMNTEFELQSLKEFVRQNKKDLKQVNKVIHQQIEKTEGNVQWMKASYEPIITWLSQGTS